MDRHDEKARETWAMQRADLEDRHTIKHGFYELDEDIDTELNNTLSRYITQALRDTEAALIERLKSDEMVDIALGGYLDASPDGKVFDRFKSSLKAIVAELEKDDGTTYPLL